MNLQELIKSRYSCRSYQAASVEPAKLDYIMECVRLAPSAVNKQPWRFRIVKPSFSAAIIAHGSTQHQCTLSPHSFTMRSGYVLMARPMAISMLPSPLSTSVWQLPNKAWAPVGCATSTLCSASSCLATIITRSHVCLSPLAILLTRQNPKSARR